MMNTTVNFTYQFLSQKFSVFSQFLFDDYIKSYLAKERRFFRRSRKDLNNRYPFEHAAALARDIRSLGLTPDKQSFLDKFRGLVTEIGNALGYVRLVRSAGMHSTAEAVKFIPDIAAPLPVFLDAAKAVESEAAADAAARQAAEVEQGGKAESIPFPRGLSTETIEAASQLDAVLANLMASFAEGSDYFRLLVSVFQHVLLAPSKGGPAGLNAGGGDSHLRNFFLIIPALCVSFVDHLRNSKDRMEKSVKGSDSFFSDDGFSVGCAYILAILKQDRAFDSLHWWDSVATQHREELAAYKAEAASLGKAKADLDRKEELAFKARRIIAAQEEYDSLFFAFSGARLFFKVDGMGDDDDVKQSVDTVLA
jgi:WASH complex subunit 7